MKMIRVAAGICALVALTACTSTQFTLPSPGATPAQRLFVANDSTNVLIFTPPFSAASSSSSLPSANAVGVGLDSTGILAVVSNAGSVTVYAAGVTSASVPYATFSNGGSTGFDTFDASGKLYVPNGSTVKVFTPPFSNASTASSTISSVANAIGATFDASSNLYITSSSGAVSVLAPPYTGAPVTTSSGLTSARGVAVIGSQLFVSNVTANAIRVYALPLTASEAPSFSITSGLNLPEGLAADLSGNLYAANLGVLNLVIFNPPFSGSSSPAITIPTSAGFSAPFGVALGK